MSFDICEYPRNHHLKQNGEYVITPESFFMLPYCRFYPTSKYNNFLTSFIHLFLLLHLLFFLLLHFTFTDSSSACVCACVCVCVHVSSFIQHFGYSYHCAYQQFFLFPAEVHDLAILQSVYSFPCQWAQGNSSLGML